MFRIATRVVVALYQTLQQQNKVPTQIKRVLVHM